MLGPQSDDMAGPHLLPADWKTTFYILVCMLGYNDWKKNSDSFRKLRNILNGEPEVNVLRISISTKYI